MGRAGGAGMDSRQATDLGQAAMDIVLLRRSVRRYLPDPVPEEVLRTVLEAGRQAPSGEDAQPWRFIVVRDKATIAELGRISGRGSGRRFTGEYVTKEMDKRFAGLQDPEKRRAVFQKLTSGAVSAFVAEAPVVIVVCGRKEVWDLPYDCSAAIENMLFVIAGMGLGACWVIAPCIDIRDELKLKEMLGVPPGYKVISIIPMGYTDRIPKPRPRIALEELCFSGRFGNPLFPPGPVTVTPGTGEAVPTALPSPPAGSFMEAVVHDLEAAFWDERGMGARYRTTLVGTEYLRRRHPALADACDPEGALAAAARALGQEGVADEVSWVSDEDNVLRISVRGCCLLRAHLALSQSGRHVYCCPCGNVIMTAIDQVAGSVSELARIEAGESGCRLVVVPYGPGSQGVAG